MTDPAVSLGFRRYLRWHISARLDSVLSSTRSVQVELPGPFGPDHDREVTAYVDGEISAGELYRRTVARYREP
jgi:hypothetical protein